jgi:outer membrane lipoprotein-sorting protein
MSTADQARVILERVVARYASITSYSDTGAVETRLNDRLRTTFSTWFKKPSFFRFEFQRPHPDPPLRSVLTRHGVGFDGSMA